MPIITTTALSPEVLHTITDTIQQRMSPTRRALSTRYPVLSKPLLFTRQTVRRTQNAFNFSLAEHKDPLLWPQIIARHQSLLRRKLGNSDDRLQNQKIINIRRALQELDGVMIQPGETFSLWHMLGRPTASKGYVPGMLLANGRIVEGMGGGLCQLSNFLCWLLLHAPTVVVERYHHSLDVFPDSGRTLPFGSGATIMYNLVDLRLKNTGPVPLQLHLWVTDHHLKGQLRAPQTLATKYHVFEKQHCFIRYHAQYYRYNQIWRNTLQAGTIINTEHIFTNCAPVLYDVNEGQLLANGQIVVKIDTLL